MEQRLNFAGFIQVRLLRCRCNPLISLKKFGRGERIRTSDLFVPNEAPYRTRPHPAVFDLLAAESVISLQ